MGQEASTHVDHENERRDPHASVHQQLGPWHQFEQAFAAVGNAVHADTRVDGVVFELVRRIRHERLTVAGPRTVVAVGRGFVRVFSGHAMTMQIAPAAASAHHAV